MENLLPTKLLVCYVSLLDALDTSGFLLPVVKDLLPVAMQLLLAVIVMHLLLVIVLCFLRMKVLGFSSEWQQLGTKKAAMRPMCHCVDEQESVQDSSPRPFGRSIVEFQSLVTGRALRRSSV